MAEVVVAADGGGGWWECAVAVVEHYEPGVTEAVEQLPDGAVALTAVEAVEGPYQQCGCCCCYYCYYY